jgi:DNA-binding response OmpR family regulator
MSKERILVVDDEEDILELIKYNLAREGYHVTGAITGEDALKKASVEAFDLIVLDLMLPGIDGLEVTKRLKNSPKTESVPIVMLSAKGEEVDIVTGLELGADDYITKPFSPRELSSRVSAVLRRAEWPAPPPRTVLRIDDRLSVDFNRHQVIVDGERIDLRPTEYRLLNHLIQNAGWVVPHDTLLAKVWGYEYRDETHYLRLYVNYLRKKIERDPANPEYILTERGVGYRFIDFKKT